MYLRTSIIYINRDMLYHILFREMDWRRKEGSSKGNHVRRNRECIKASLDFSKEIILVNTCEDYIKFFLERI